MIFYLKVARIHSLHLLVNESRHPVLMSFQKKIPEESRGSFYSQEEEYQEQQIHHFPLMGHFVKQKIKTSSSCFRKDLGCSALGIMSPFQVLSSRSKIN